MENGITIVHNRRPTHPSHFFNEAAGQFRRREDEGVFMYGRAGINKLLTRVSSVLVLLPALAAGADGQAVLVSDAGLLTAAGVVCP